MQGKLLMYYDCGGDTGQITFFIIIPGFLTFTTYFVFVPE